jgi:acetylornithine deacetylase
MVSLGVREHADEIVGFLQELVGCERPSNPPALARLNAQDRVEADVEELGLETRRLAPDLAQLSDHAGYRETAHDYGERPVVIGRAPGAGGGRSLVPNGHADIVGAGDSGGLEASAARWRPGRRPHFQPRRRRREGPLTALLFGLACAREVSDRLRGDVTFMSVADEELGGVCTLAALAAGYTADAALVGEPTGLAVAPASRGAASFRLDVSRREAHSGVAFRGVNAILKTMKYVAAMEQLQRDLDWERPRPLYAGSRSHTASTSGRSRAASGRESVIPRPASTT